MLIKSCDRIFPLEPTRIMKSLWKESSCRRRKGLDSGQHRRQKKRRCKLHRAFVWWWKVNDVRTSHRPPLPGLYVYYRGAEKYPIWSHLVPNSEPELGFRVIFFPSCPKSKSLVSTQNRYLVPGSFDRNWGTDLASDYLPSDCLKAPVFEPLGKNWNIAYGCRNSLELRIFMR